MHMKSVLFLAIVSVKMDKKKKKNQPVCCLWWVIICFSFSWWLILVLYIYTRTGQCRCKRILSYLITGALQELIDESRRWTLSLPKQAPWDEHVVCISCWLHCFFLSIFFQNFNKRWWCSCETPELFQPIFSNSHQTNDGAKWNRQVQSTLTNKQLDIGDFINSKHVV